MVLRFRPKALWTGRCRWHTFCTTVQMTLSTCKLNFSTSSWTVCCTLYTSQSLSLHRCTGHALHAPSENSHYRMVTISNLLIVTYYPVGQWWVLNLVKPDYYCEVHKLVSFRFFLCIHKLWSFQSGSHFWTYHRSHATGRTLYTVRPQRF